jgi:HSP20 family molecular chaperone IbpA
MNRPVLFDSPFLLGFEPTRALIERVARAAGDGYPPYNVEEIGEGELRISLAVAGFSPADLSVTEEDSQLVISGRREEATDGGKDADKAYLHRGIAARAFLRIFVLADGMEVTGATVEHGLLHVDLTRKTPAKLVKRIPIRAAG